MSRLLSPAGFILVGLLILLPFFRVTFLSGVDAVTLAYDGTDLLAGGTPTVVRPEGLVDEASLFLRPFAIDRQPFAIAALAVLVASLFTALVRDRLMRHASALGLAVLIGALLFGAYLRATHALDERLLANNRGDGYIAPHIPSPWIGFWLMIGTLNLLVIGHAMAFARAWGPQVVPRPDEHGSA